MGALPSGTIADKFGRKYSLIAMSMVFTIGMVIEVTTESVEQLCVGQFIGGFGVGAMSMMGMTTDFYC